MRVLVVEDEALVALLLEEMLAELGHEVIGTHATVSSAEAAAERTTADLVVLDLNLAGRRTDRVAEILKRRGIPIILASGFGSPQPQSSTIVVLPKPYALHDLRGAIARLVTDGSRSAD